MLDFKGGPALRGLHRFIAGVAGIICWLAISLFGCQSVPALAAQTHLFEASFGPDGTSSTHFERPTLLAIDQSTGNVYVGDGFPGETIQKFNVTHEPEPFTGISENISGGKLTGFSIHLAGQLAVSPTNSDLYVEAGTESVRAYQPDGEPVPFTAGSAAGHAEIQGSEVCGVAVDSNGDIYASEYNGGIQIYKSTGEFIKTISIGGACNLAVDSTGDVYANILSSPVANSSGPVEELVPSSFPVTAATTYTSAGTVDPNPSRTVAVDPATNDLYVDEGNQIAQYDPSGVHLGNFGMSGAHVLPSVEIWGAAIAINGLSGLVYIAQGNYEGQVEIFGRGITLPDVTTGQASQISAKGTATLNGEVNPDGLNVTECQFDYGPTEAYGKSAPCRETVGSGTSLVPVSAGVAGLEPGMTYHFRLQASAATAPEGVASTGSDEVFSTPPRPAVHGESVANLTATSVDLNATVNPGGLTTSCEFEYGATAEYTNNAPCEPSTFEGSVDIPVTQHLQDLISDRTYHWRVSATNEAGTAHGPDHTFIYSTLAKTLPDNRAYEMVTPPHKNGALIGDVLGMNPDIAEGGARIILSSIQCFGGSESCTASRQSEGEQFLFSRSATGWQTTPLAPPASRFQENSSWLASAETEMELFSMPTPPTLEDDFYKREVDGSFVDIGPGTPPEAGPGGFPWDQYVIRATSNFSHVVFQEPALWPPVGATGNSPYEYAGGGNKAPTFVAVIGGRGSVNPISACGAELGSFEGETSEYPNEVSSDGETVYFTARPCAGAPVASLYARVNREKTIPISEPSAFSSAAPYSGCDSEPCVADVNDSVNWGNAFFAGASSDGSRAFFTSDQRLTDDAGSGNNLYEYAFTEPTQEGSLPASGLIDLSAGDTSGQGPRVQGVVAISSDGSHIYFVAQGVLTDVANALGQTAKQGADNLYVFEKEGHTRGRVAFITQLSELDSQQWQIGSAGDTSNVTPDGRFLVFESHGDLTRDTIRTDGAEQIFRYDAQTGDLVRISIGENGINDNGNGGIGNARIVPAFDGWHHAGPARSDPTMSHDGAFVFFESPIALTAHALNDVRIGTTNGEPSYAANVYEWHDGHVYLISDGRDASAGLEDRSAVKLIGSDEEGHNVFFTSADALVPQDTDTQVDFYDAHICEPRDPCIAQSLQSLPPCLGEVCHGTPTGSPVGSKPPTETFNGQGNQRASSNKGSPRKRGAKTICRHRRPMRGHGCIKSKHKKRRVKRSTRKGRP